MEIAQKKIESKIGVLYLVASGDSLKGVFWDKQEVPFQDGLGRVSEILREAEKQIIEYLNGARKQFSIKLDPEGTQFQKKVWTLLSQIPYGETCSYKDIAIKLNNPNACRAVGTANGQNPLSLIVPCHRVISSDGSLGGYAGGLDRKRHLLSLEKNQSPVV